MNKTALKRDSFTLSTEKKKKSFLCLNLITTPFKSTETYPDIKRRALHTLVLKALKP